ncbi:hypothetical protein SAMN03159338_2041 [Sphingomonas sp. NFR04]|uniref:hypothetical protein n=1 Tax=Sphingomonas sp. NFR04 TaxID=1566283 RepID=UPI0008EC006B|nr:hypothetical protein [Sphingomonas sp. NFR04]SFJ64534.1 hypothetical protein SAMN03159338_2041 [Sphingomonas sp. NFR04]
MPADNRAPVLARIAQMREQRLTRALIEAREAAEQAHAAASAAEAARTMAERARGDARLLFQASPACPQTRLWLDQRIAEEFGAAARASDQRARHEIAVDAQGDAGRALEQHRVRSESVAAHHQTLRRAEQRRAEDRVDGEAAAFLLSRGWA